MLLSHDVRESFAITIMFAIDWESFANNMLAIVAITICCQESFANTTLLSIEKNLL